MGEVVKSFVLAALAWFLVASNSAFASGHQTVTLRGGLGVGADEYPYAFDEIVSTAPIVPIMADYGTGGFLQATYAHPWKLPGLRFEHGIKLSRFSGDNTYGDPSDPTICANASLIDLISLSHSLCMNAATTQSETIALHAHSSVVSSNLLPQIEVLGGIGVLAVASESSGEMFFPGELSVQARQSGFEGYGFVAGARYGRPLGAFHLNLEAQAGVYFGQRIVEIADNYEGVVGALQNTSDGVAKSAEITVSLSRPMTLQGRNAQLEFGVNYTGYFDVLDTANYNTSSAPTGSASPSGSTTDDFSALTVFAGVSMDF